MTRLELNDLLVGSFINALKQTGQPDQAEKVEAVYAGQRAELIANQEVDNAKA